MSLAPISARERVATLDVLRAFALLGVLTANIYWDFSGRIFGLANAHRTTADAAADWFILIFVQSKAQTLLTLLFGFGFANQLLRAEARGEPVTAMYVRRLLVLFCVGFLHVTLLWWGDVTWHYALAGFGLLVFQRASNRTRVIAALALTIIPFAVFMIFSADLTLGAFMPPHGSNDFTRHMADVIQHGSWAQASAAHAEFAFGFAIVIGAWYFPWVLGRFLVGYVVGKLRWFDNDAAGHLPQFRKVLVAGICLVVPGAAAWIAVNTGAIDPMSLPYPLQLAIGLLDQAELIGMVMVYVASVVLLMQRPAARRLLVILAPLGRMPLTTYISQSVICAALFYHWGFGWAGLGETECLLVAAVIYAVQIAIAQVWLRNFRFGPLEWVWRTLVYMKRQPMRLSAE